MVHGKGSEDNFQKSSSSIMCSPGIEPRLSCLEASAVSLAQNRKPNCLNCKLQQCSLSSHFCTPNLKDIFILQSHLYRLNDNSVCSSS